MDLAKVLQQLHEELENLNSAISSLERLQEAGKQRSKTPEWLENIQPVRGRRKRSEESAAKPGKGKPE